MIHVTKQLDFSEGPLGVNLVVKRIRNLLDGNMLIRLRVQRRTIHTQQTKGNQKFPSSIPNQIKKNPSFFLHSINIRKNRTKREEHSKRN